MDITMDDILKDNENDNEHDEFFFESEHLALKGNKDYLSLLKTLALLQAQRTRALQDLDIIQEVKHRALRDPDTFIAILQAGGDLGVPNRQVIAEVPVIDWSEYNSSVPDHLLRPVTRKVMGGGQSTAGSGEKKERQENTEGKVTVRGRAFDQSKPETFNQLWTTEEQRRLEELLIEFPPEEVESRRFKKIAEALGNRTCMQVSSRVQKYFLKLMKAGLPIPGRAPRVTSESVKKGSHGRQRTNHFLSRPSTFFPQHQDLPVYMPEGEDQEDLPENAETLLTIKREPTDDAASDDQRKFILLQQVRKDKENNTNVKQAHLGFKCDMCAEEPIVGTRWHCQDCPDTLSTDFCSDCLVTQLDSAAPHPLFHRFEAVRAIAPCSSVSVPCDPDYLPQSFSETYNYLDPNFLPH